MVEPIDRTGAHLEDDELVLHYYGEMTGADEGRASAHLAACRTCHANYRGLQRVLAAVDQAAVAGPEPPDGFERTVWARLAPHLTREVSGWFSWLVLSPARLVWIAAVVVLVAGAYFAGRLAPRAIDDGPISESTGAEQVRERILLVDLGDHLDRSQMVLVELASADDRGTVDISGERARAEELVAANRLYRQTAAATGDAAIIDLLDDLDRVLVDIAASPEHLSSRGLAEVQRRIETDGLLFKVRVVSSEVRERQKSAIRARTGQRSTL
jgi:hypothetical protein